MIHSCSTSISQVEDITITILMLSVIRYVFPVTAAAVCTGISAANTRTAVRRTLHIPQASFFICTNYSCCCFILLYELPKSSISQLKSVFFSFFE